MNIKHFLIAAALLFTFNAQAQNVRIGATAGAPNASSMLDLDGITGLAQAKGALLPRVTQAQRLAMNPLPAPAQGLLVYQTNIVGASLEGFYYNISTTVVPNWVYLATDKTSWLLTGNAGTVPGTNFIGTLDAQPFLVKTGGSAATNERMRVLATGEVIVNNTTVGANVGDVFSVYSNATSNGTTNTSAIGAFAINGYANGGLGTSAGVYGENSGAGIAMLGLSTGGGYGVYGSTNANGTSPGVFGENFAAAAALPANASAYGIYGYTNRVASGTGGVRAILGLVDPTVTTGGAYGVQGQTANPTGLGMFGINTSITGSAVGVQGQSASVNSQALVGIGNTSAGAIPTATFGYGVIGQINGTIAAGTGVGVGVRGIINATMTTGDARGVYGSSPSQLGTGVMGIATSVSAAAADQPVGVYGRAASARGFGVQAVNTDLNGTGIITVGNNAAGQYLVAGSGAAFNGTATGSFSRATNATGGTGATAISNGATSTTLVSGSGLAGTSTLAGVAGFSAGGAAGTNRSGGYFSTNAGAAYAYVGLIDATNTVYKINGLGLVATVVKDVNDKNVNLVCPEAPEALFQDFGQGQLVNGKAHIEIDPVFTKNIIVSEKHPLRAFIQLRGDCKGVYVTNETATGFDVIELQGGTSNTKFNWTVTANRADEMLPDGSISKYSDLRFAPSAGAMQTTTQAVLPVSTSRESINETEPQIKIEQEISTKDSQLHIAIPKSVKPEKK